VRDTRRTRIALGGLLAAAALLIAAGRLGAAYPLRALGGTMLGAAERGMASATGSLAAVLGGPGAAGSGAKVNELERELISARLELSAERLDRAEYDQLARLLRLSSRERYRVVAATVIAVGQGWEQAVTLGAGSRQGVRAGDTVLNGAGLVGTVTRVSPSTCTVLLDSDAGAVVGVRLAGSGLLGWVTGSGAGLSGPALLRLRVLGPATGLATGEEVVTSASVGGRPYVPGIPVGVVIRVLSAPGPQGSLTATALVRPYADPAALDVVGIVIAGRGLT